MKLNRAYFTTPNRFELTASRDARQVMPSIQKKRSMIIYSLFDTLEIRKNYYYDRQRKSYVCLLNGFLQFDGAKRVSPLFQ